MNLQFTVLGQPIPQGSTRAFIPKGWKRPVITAANSKTMPWRQEIAGVALTEAQRSGFQMVVGAPVRIVTEFMFDRPKSVKVPFKITKPDLDKLLRSVLDALTGVLFKDDSQVIESHAYKRFQSPAGVHIFVGELA